MKLACLKATFTGAFKTVRLDQIGSLKYHRSLEGDKKANYPKSSSKAGFETFQSMQIYNLMLRRNTILKTVCQEGKGAS